MEEEDNSSQSTMDEVVNISGLVLLSDMAALVAMNEAILHESLKGLCESNPNLNPNSKTKPKPEPKPKWGLHAKSPTILTFKHVKADLEKRNYCPESRTGIDLLPQTSVLPRKKISVMQRKWNQNVAVYAADLAAGVKRKRFTCNTNGEEEAKLARPATPKECEKEIRDILEGTDIVVVIEKRLSETDLKKNNSRLSIPVKQIQGTFLNPEEEKDLKEKESMEVLFVEPCLHTTTLTLRRWKMGDSVTYNLTKKWNWVVNKGSNELHVNDLVQLWSFRQESRLCFALVKV